MKDVMILDCTLRDGGYYNNWDFSKDIVNDYLKTMSAVNINYVEVGFRSFQSKDFKGPTWYTTDSYLESLDIQTSALLLMFEENAQHFQSEQLLLVLGTCLDTSQNNY